MNVLEKAEKALEYLKNVEGTAKSHELQAAAQTLGRCLGALGSRQNCAKHYANLLHAALPVLLSLASNNSAEIRLIGDEALNRAVVGGFAFHSYKTNILLQNQIDHTKNARWIRAALSRICLGDCWLRPGVGKIRSQAQTLFPKLTQIVKQTNDIQLILEALESNLPRVLPALADYTTDEEICDLSKALLTHIESSEAAVRRGVGSCVAHLVAHRELLLSNVLGKVFGIAPPCVRREIASSVEKAKQEADPRHPLYGCTPVPSRLKSRKSFLGYAVPINDNPAAARSRLWKEVHQVECYVPQKERLSPGHKLQWQTWKSLNRLRTQVGRCKDNLCRWGYCECNTCECGAVQTMPHLLICPMCPCSSANNIMLRLRLLVFAVVITLAATDELADMEGRWTAVKAWGRYIDSNRTIKFCHYLTIKSKGTSAKCGEINTSIGEFTEVIRGINFPAEDRNTVFVKNGEEIREIQIVRNNCYENTAVIRRLNNNYFVQIFKGKTVLFVKNYPPQSELNAFLETYVEEKPGITYICEQS